MAEIDRRKHPRFEGRFLVDLLNMGDDPTVSPYEAVVPATALDVSIQGLRLRSAYKVPMGTVMSVILYYKERGSVCLCEVVWRQEQMGEFTYGLYIAEWSQLDSVLAEKLHSMEMNHEQIKRHNTSSSSAPTAALSS